MRYPFASLLVAEIGPSMGIKVELEPEYQFAGELIFENGRRHLFRNTNFNVNPAGSIEIAKDKGYTNFFLRKHGINAPEHRAFFSDKLNANLDEHLRRGLQDAIKYAESIGPPIFIKPNNLSQGTLVTKIYELDDISRVAKQIFSRTDVLLIETVCPGRDYRIVVLGHKIISAYERIPLTVWGDGRSSIDQLVEASRQEFKYLGRPNSEIDPLDDRIDIKLASLGMHRASIPLAGEEIVLLDNANLSTGGTSVDVTGTIHPSFARIAIRATHLLGLQLCGVDIITKDLTAAAAGQTWNIIELNGAPGLDNYAALGPEQAARVRGLYREILDYLASHDFGSSTVGSDDLGALSDDLG